VTTNLNNFALVISDLHLRHNHFDMAQMILKKAEIELDRLKPKYLIIGGDTFHSKNVMHANMLVLFEAFLQRVTKKCIVICLIGNHDWAIPYSIHSLQTLSYIENLILVDTTYRLNEKVGFIGYCREQSRFEDLMKNLQGCEILFGHLDLNGFELGSGWEESDAFCGEERFTSFKKVFSGHFHKAQQRTLASGTEIIYVGTGYNTDFNEADQEKRFLLVNLDTGEWEGIPTNMTLHRTIRTLATEPLPVLDEAELAKGVNYRVVVVGTKEQIAAYRVPKDYPAKILPEFKNNEESRLNINATDNHDEMMKKYMNYELKRSFGDDANIPLNKEKLFKIGRRILAQSKAKG
jgi:DNA repair exonuclease SbcCD nuclease subunit